MHYKLISIVNYSLGFKATINIDPVFIFEHSWSVVITKKVTEETQHTRVTDLVVLGKHRVVGSRHIVLIEDLYHHSANV